MKRINLIIILIFTVLSLQLDAQTGINSPYSRYGLGQLYLENLNTVSVAMGGLGIALHDPTILNPANPASYGTLDSSAFLFEVGVSGNATTLKTNTLTESGYDATLSYIFIGFPITRWWRSGAGIMPFSKIGYNVQVLVPVDNFSDVVHSFSGDGGLNRVFWGNGFNISENLRVGIDASYLFGQSSRLSMIFYPDSSNIFGTKVENHISVGDFIFDYGIQYDLKLGEKTKLTIGATYAQKFNLSANYNYLSKTIIGGYNGLLEQVVDTIEYRPDEEGSIVLPARLGFGLALTNEGNWMIGADFEWQKWKEFEAFGVEDSLSNSWRVTLGGAFTPKHTNISSIFKRMTYRAGLRYNQSYLKFYNNPITEFGISFGVSFPLKNSKTGIDLGVDFGRRGTTDNDLIQENFVDISLGISIQENWFQKRKYR